MHYFAILLVCTLLNNSYRKPPQQHLLALVALSKHALAMHDCSCYILSCRHISTSLTSLLIMGWHVSILACSCDVDKAAYLIIVHILVSSAIETAAADVNLIRTAQQGSYNNVQLIDHQAMHDAI
jgi:hypothetical protein